MAFPDEPRGAETPTGESMSESPEQHIAPGNTGAGHESEPAVHVSGEVLSDASHSQYEEAYSYSDDWASSGRTETAVALTPPPPAALPSAPPPAASPSAPPGGSRKPPRPPEPPDEEDHEEEGMARMSFLEHLEELRKRILLALGGVGIAFVLCLCFSDQLWNVVFGPAGRALQDLHVNPPTLKLISPMDTF